MISVVVPVRNEPDLGVWLDRTSPPLEKSEIIVVDTSPDGPAALKPAPNLKYVHAPHLQTRAEAMNEGARIAGGSTLLFLHADCEPPLTAEQEISDVVEKGSVGGAFRKQYSPGSLPLKLQSIFLNHVARKSLRGVTGTNGIFVRKDLFHTWGGFRQVPLCEDLMFWDRLRAHGRVAVLSSTILASSRRYRSAWGLPRMVRNALVLALFRMGLSVRWIDRIYRA